MNFDYPDFLERHVIPTPDCDLVVYHRPGTRGPVNTKAENNGESEGSLGKKKPHPVIFYHGACGQAAMWDNQFELLPEFDLYFVDVRGQGESKMKQGLPDFAGAVADVSRIYDYFGFERASLVGHSWGGNPLQEFTYRHGEKVRSLVLSGSWGQHREMGGFERLSLKFTKPLYSVIPWGPMAKMSAKACSDVPETQEKVRASIYEAGRGVFVNLGMSAYAKVHPIDHYPGNPPMLFIRGSKDFPKGLSPIYSYLESINPNARQIVIEGTVHQPMNDTPDEFNRILTDFLAEVDAAG